MGLCLSQLSRGSPEAWFSRRRGVPSSPRRAPTLVRILNLQTRNTNGVNQKLGACGPEPCGETQRRSRETFRTVPGAVAGDREGSAELSGKEHEGNPCAIADTECQSRTPNFYWKGSALWGTGSEVMSRLGSCWPTRPTQKDAGVQPGRELRGSRSFTRIGPQGCPPDTFQEEHPEETGSAADQGVTRVSREVPSRQAQWSQSQGGRGRVEATQGR